MADDNHRCLPGKGCAPLIDLTKQAETSMAALIEGHKAHAEMSEKFWADQRSHLGELVLQIRECVDDAQKSALLFKDGHYEMAAIRAQNETDKNAVISAVNGVGKRLDDHVISKTDTNGHHLLNRRVKALGMAILVISLFLAVEHRDFLLFPIKVLGVKLGWGG